jgi:hypothetical protein
MPRLPPKPGPAATALAGYNRTCKQPPPWSATLSAQLLPSARARSTVLWRPPSSERSISKENIKPGIEEVHN